LKELTAHKSGKDRTVVSYKTGDDLIASIEPVKVGDNLPDIALYLSNHLYVMVPLESTYRTTWEISPEGFRGAVETGVMPEA
jgi:hypothetical protein